MKKLQMMIVLTAMILIVISATPLSAAETETVTGSKLLAITFDDGPSANTIMLLDGLKVRDAKATFFIVGNRVAAMADIVKREYEEGHELANHSWDHCKLSSLSQGDFNRQLSQTKEAIDAACGKDVGPLLLRPPGGNSNDQVKAWANTPIVLWTVDPLDWKYRNADSVKDKIVAGARDGAIILVHDLYPTSVQGALAAIDILQDQGYSFVTVKELYRRKGMEMAAGVVYNGAPANGVDLGPIDPYAFDESKLDEHWAYSYITYAKENHLMKGANDDTFKPNYPMTRAMFVTAISRLGNKEIKGYVNPFKDVENNQWYTKAIAWAAAKKIVNVAENEKFHPNAYITREEACMMMANYMKYLNIYSLGNGAQRFDDYDSISPWAQDAVMVMAEHGIMTGVGNGKFEPQANTTRAQSAVILTRFHKLVKNNVSISLSMARDHLLKKDSLLGEKNNEK